MSLPTLERKAASVRFRKLRRGMRKPLALTLRLSRTVRIVVLLVSAASYMTTQTTRFICAGCEARGMFFETYPTQRSANMHITKTPQCRAASMGIKTIVVETRPTDTMVGGSGASGAVPDLRHQPPGYFSVKKM